MQIEIISVNVENKGKYRLATVNYKDSKGEVDAKKVVSFANKDVFKLMSEAKLGDRFNVRSEKNEAGHWNWVEATPEGKNLGAASDNPSAKAGQARGNFETPEERAKRQVYIVRQSSFSSAIEFLRAQGTVPTDVNHVIGVAKNIEAYVFAVPEVEIE